MLGGGAESARRGTEGVIRKAGGACRSRGDHAFASSEYRLSERPAGCSTWSGRVIGSSLDRIATPSLREDLLKRARRKACYGLSPAGCAAVETRSRGEREAYLPVVSGGRPERVAQEAQSSWCATELWVRGCLRACGPTRSGRWTSSWTPDDGADGTYLAWWMRARASALR